MLKTFKTALISLLANDFVLATSSNSSSHADEYRSFREVCFENGYALENYQLITSDDYMLSLYHIPGSLQELKTP